MRVFSTLAIAALLLVGSAFAQELDQCNGKPVQYTIKVPVGEGDTREALRQTALLQAQTEIIQQYCGSDVSSTTVVEDAMLASHRVLDISRGLITSLKLINRGSYEGDMFAVTVEATPTRISGTADPEFTVSAQMDKDAYNDGDKGFLTGTVSKAAYLYVFNIASDNSVALLFPTRVMADNQFAPGNFRLFADKDKPGLQFGVDPSQKSKRLREFMVVVATKKPLDLTGTGIKEAIGRPLTINDTATSTALAKALLNLKRDEIAQTAAAYDLYRKPSSER